MLHIAICDDEQVCLNEIKTLLLSFMQQKDIETEVSAFSHPFELSAAFEKGQLFEIYLLDVYMPGMTGITLALWRRLSDEGALSLESLSMDFVPLILLFAISVTGLALTASTLWLRGSQYEFLAILHAITVISALLYLPFGKFFHIFQRPAQLGVKLYQKAGEEEGPALCARCGAEFATKMQIEDLRQLLPQLGFDYSMKGEAEHWQAVCPECKRKSIALSQLRAKESARVQVAAAGR